MVTNTGAYIDCPFHRFEDGKDISQMPLECFVNLDAIVIHVPFTENIEITEEYLKGCDVKNRVVPPKFKGVGTFPVRAYAKF